GRATTLLAMVASVVVAALGHMSTAGMLEPTVALVVCVGAIPALCLVAFIELLVLDADVQVGRKRKAKATKQETTAPKPEVKAEVTPVSPAPTPKTASLTVVKGESVPGPEERIMAAVQALGDDATYSQIIAWSKEHY